MICPPCKAAGGLNLLIQSEPNETFAARITLEAQAVHADCEWPKSCPCQHKTGKVIAKASEVPK